MSDDTPEKSFREATQESQKGLIAEFWAFMSENAKWWLIPFLIVFGLLGIVLVLGSTGAAPFIYTMF